MLLAQISVIAVVVVIAAVIVTVVLVLKRRRVAAKSSSLSDSMPQEMEAETAAASENPLFNASNNIWPDAWASEGEDEEPAGDKLDDDGNFYQKATDDKSFDEKSSE